jgi:two-component system LytT family response regulator
MGYGALIVDDERLARERLRALLRHEPDFTVVGEAANAEQALAAIASGRPDLVFLDIEMPGGDGFEVVRRMAPPVPQIVFVTAHQEHAVAAFEIEAFDFLLKPFDRARFEKTVARVRARLGARTAPPRDVLGRLLAALEGQGRHLSRLAVTASGRTRFVDVAAIDWIEAEDNYVTIHGAGASHLVRETLAHLESRLDPAQFVRVHRSALVNVAAVRELKTLFHGDLELQLRGGSAVRVGRSYRTGLRERIGGG